MTAAKRPAKRPRQTVEAKRLNEVIAKALEAAKAKGWSADVESRDRVSHRYASVHARRRFGMQDVSGTIELDVSEAGIKSQRAQHSFYGHGLDTLHDAIMDNIRTLPWIAQKPPAIPSRGAPGSLLLSTLEGMLRRFDRYARQLTRRHADRAGIPVNDEYDVQDLLHALLRSITDDVRAEEVSPSYAGASSRLDFLLKKEGIVVEAKMASAKLRDKDVGEQLIIDIRRYQAHPSCKALLCLVYDPGNHIKNPQGLQVDLTGKHGDLAVKVLVVPQ